MPAAKPTTDDNDTPVARKRKKLALGRGLDALIPDMGDPNEPQRSADYLQVDVEAIRPNRYQPRTHFSDAELEELTRSVRTQGVLQPLLVRPTDQGYELIAGERRLRAARRAGLRQVPVVVKRIDDTALLEISIVENIQREDLNPLEEAEAYHQMMNTFELTQEQVAERVGRSRPAVANLLRLRQLPEPIKAAIRDGRLSMGHARALLGADTSAQQNAAFAAIQAKALSVRQAETLIKRLRQQQHTRRSPDAAPDVHLTRLAEDLSRDFGTRVQITRQGRKGKVEIEFYNDDDLDRLIRRLHRWEGVAG